MNMRELQEDTKYLDPSGFVVMPLRRHNVKLGHIRRLCSISPHAEYRIFGIVSSSARPVSHEGSEVVHAVSPPTTVDLFLSPQATCSSTLLKRVPRFFSSALLHGRAPVV